MRLVLIIIAALVALSLWYALFGRKWLLTRPWAEGFFRFVEPVELALFKKSETILVGRLLWLGGGLVTLYDTLAVFASSLDLTPLTAHLLYWIPEDMRGLAVSAFIAAIGLLVNWLRMRTSKPMEIVSLPIDTPREIAAPAEQAVAASEQAVATIQAAQAEGKV